MDSRKRSCSYPPKKSDPLYKEIFFHKKEQKKQAVSNTLEKRERSKKVKLTLKRNKAP